MSDCGRKVGNKPDRAAGYRAGAAIGRRAFLLGLGLVAGGAGLATELDGTDLNLTGSDIWTDEQTGIAIGAYDPVSYYLDTRPRQGDPHYEYVWGSVAWWFANEGNRSAFVDAPSVYAPRFGGYDTLALARRALVRGDPLTWDIWDGQLYLFATPINRQIWSAERRRISVKAVGFWRERLGSRAPTLELSG